MTKQKHSIPFDLIILHDSNGRPYYEAVEWLQEASLITQISYYESSVVKLALRAIIFKNFTKISMLRFVKNIFFRLQLPFVGNKIIIMGMGPYDYRILFYSMLIRKNRLIFHSSWPYWGTDKFPRNYLFLNKFLIKVWKRFLANPNLTIVTVTDEARGSLTKFSNIQGSIKTIPHSVNTRTFYPKSSFPTADDKLGILYVGKFTKEKGLDIFAEVIAKGNMQQYLFGLIGSGNYLKSIQNIFNKPNVSYHGFVSDKEILSDIYREYDVLLVPSIRSKKWEELFGIVVIEAMSAGLVVIASNHVGPSTIIQDGYNGFLVEEGNSNIILEKMSYLSEFPSELSRISYTAIETARQYSVEKVGNRWKEVLLYD